MVKLLPLLKPDISSFCDRFHVNAIQLGSEKRSLGNVTRRLRPPPPKQQNVVVIDAATLRKAQRMSTGCEACSEDAEIPFDNILDRLAGSDPSVTDYVLEAPIRCFHCGAEINEKTLVEWVGDAQTV